MACSSIQVIANIESKSSFLSATSKGYAFISSIHMLFTVPLPGINRCFISILKRVEKLFTVAKEAVFSCPCLHTICPKLPAILIFNNKKRVIIFSTFLKERNHTATISIKSECEFPITLSLITWQHAYKIADLNII